MLVSQPVVCAAQAYPEFVESCCECGGGVGGGGHQTGTASQVVIVGRQALEAVISGGGRLVQEKFENVIDASSSVDPGAADF